MPSLGRFPCESCEYVATNRRMLSRHVVVAHSDKVYKCPLCPFITRYAANWYRHKRSLHGVRKTTTCEVCGFFANSVEDLNQHIEVEHPQHLQLRRLQQEYALEKELLGAGPASNLNLAYTAAAAGHNGEVNSFDLDNGIHFLNNSLNESIVTNDDSVKFSLPLNGGFFVNDLHTSSNPGQINATSPLKMDLVSQDYGNLSPPKVRRSYCCDLCGLLTSNPREFLYHQRDVHNMRVNVFECKLCIYASKHVQKLQRHYGLVHRQKLPPEERPVTQKPAKKKVTAKKTANNTQNISPPKTADSLSPYEFPGDEPENEIPLKTVKKKAKVNMLKCATCSYQTRNKFLLSHHERTVHLKKKFYRCLQCGYVTNEKARYTKHMKYHNLPKMQCEFCHFKSAYKWNMERHLKNHSIGGEGQFNCTLCTFITHSKQSLKLHVTNHHQPEESQIDDKQDESFLDLPMDGSETLEQAPFEYDESNPQNLYPPIEERSNMVWDDEPETQKLLRCNTCDYQTKWSFELRKHEETHKSPKRHSCPLCGMGFEHIAWLTKHLTRIHKEDSQAKSLAAAFELLKPKRRRYIKKTEKPQNADVNPSKQTFPTKETPQVEKQSVLSSLLRNTEPSKYVSILPKSDLTNKFAMLANEPIFSQEDSESFNEPTPPKKYSRKVPNCKVCGYKTKWISELEKHMRVHSDHKPFQCARCSYHSKWKGDLTRHMVKHHGVKISLGSKKIPKIRLRKTLPNNKLVSTNRWQTVKQEPSSTAVKSSENKEQELPLDLTICRDNIFLPNRAPKFKDDAEDSDEMNYSIDNDLQNEFIESDEERNDKEPLLSKKEEGLETTGGKKKYYCPFCSFTTSTPSRFHVHIVQHYNKKPFMCSVCNYRSNWEWDITKHIRLRGCKDKEHNSACVLLTDETGRRNYEKYDKYLKPERKVAPKVIKRRDSPRRRTVSSTTEGKSKVQEITSASSAAAINHDDPVNIVVTPDISFSDDGMESVNSMNFNTDLDVANNSDLRNNGFKFYLCKHCNYKHSSRKLVISHLSVHAGIKPFRCRVCGLTANWRHAIVRHVKAAHNGYMNDVEDRITYTQEGFVIRITSVKTGNKPDVATNSRTSQYTCKFCPYKCDKEVYIKFHMKQHKPREGAIYQCNFCPYYVKFKKTLVRHLKLHNPSSPSASTEYSGMNSMFQQNMSFDSDEQDNVNGYNNNGQMGFFEDSIKVCYDKLKAETVPEPVIKFKRHICEHCPYRTDNRTQYLYHKQFHRPNNSAPFKCSLCTYWASMQHLLTQHMKVHGQDVIQGGPNDGVNNSKYSPVSDGGSEIPMILVQRGGVSTKMFQCRFCPMTNKKRANVRVHERMHTATQTASKYTCNLCNYKCSGQGSLTNHMKIHQNESPSKSQHRRVTESGGQKRKVFSYFCSHCPAVFKNSSDLYVHRSFHGANLPYACTNCDYRAKHKPHLQKHLQVHTPAYVAKRDATYGAPMSFADDNATDFLDDGLSEVPVFTKKIDQMLLLEAAEVEMFLQKGMEFAEKNMHKCPLCPSYFAKTAILTYHSSLHGSKAEYACSQCDYATSRSANLTIHSRVHPKVTSPTKRPVKVFDCPKCPATFNKADRFDRHFNLHGKNFRYVCDQCDYSVRFAANLSKHRLVHGNVVKKIVSNSEKINIMPPPPPPPVITETKQTLEKTPDSSKAQENGEEKKIYLCDRCPYYQGRKDAVQSHQQRHNQKDGYQCPYCDYRSLGSSFLRDHVKMHMTPNNLFPPQAYMTYGAFKIWVVSEGSKELLFEDKGPEYNICDRFHPVLKSRKDLISSDENCDDPAMEEESVEDPVQNPLESETVVDSSVFLKPAPVEKKTKETDNKEPQSQLLPKVVLRDIFSTGKVKQLDNGSVMLHSDDQEETSSDTSHSTLLSTVSSTEDNVKQIPNNLLNGTCEKNTTKSSIIVKIKVENIVEDNNERSLYTISSKKNKTDTNSDAASDVTITADDMDDLSPELELTCDESDIIGSETAEDILNTAGVDANFSNMAFKETEPFEDVTFDGSSSESLKGISDKDNAFQQTGTDFLKQLDFMVNSVSMNISPLKTDQPSASLHSPLML